MSRVLRACLVLLTCLGLASASFAAAHGHPRARGAKDPAALVVLAAKHRIGLHYVWGAVGPATFDCSGLTSTLWRTAGHVSIPRTSAQQQAWAIPIPVEQALPGDLAFFGAPVTHVGLIVQRLPSGQLLMVDASASRKVVGERLVWSSGVVRFGRVPRRTMVAVRPWKPPVTRHLPLAPVTGPVVDPHNPALKGRRPFVGFRWSQTGASGRQMRNLVAQARRQVGSTRWTDTQFAAVMWRRAGGAKVAPTRLAIARDTRPVRPENARAGDLVVYGEAAAHVGVYVGRGWMIDASRVLGHVVLRPVWASADVQVRRWNR